MHQGNMFSKNVDLPVGIMFSTKLLHRCGCKKNRSQNLVWYRAGILLLTFMAYTFYHLSRKSISVVKNVLNQNCSTVTRPSEGFINNTHWCDWAPFDGENSATLLGILDSSFLFAYAFAMFFSGYVAERVDLRFFLSLGMIGSGIFSYLFGIARSYEIHNLWYFIFVQIFAGIFQTTGWPGVVTVVGNWFGKGKRGLIFGIWNSHTSVGNILGSVIAAEFVETDWGLSFIIPGLIIAFGGFVIFLFLVAHPSHITYQETDSSHPKALDRHSYQPVESQYSSDSESGLDELCAEDAQLIYGRKGDSQSSLAVEPSSPTPAVTTETAAVGFLGACRIPGVIEYSACLFFGKLVSYTFLYWLPLYIGSSTSLSASLSADLSTVFDFGGILGGIACGVLSDYTGKSAVVCSVMLIFAVPMMFIYESFGAENMTTNISLLLIVGFLVNGPYALITTAVSAELGTHSSLQGNSRALATVTAIIDGTGSIGFIPLLIGPTNIFAPVPLNSTGAAVGPLLAGVISSYGWRNVFYMLMVSDVMALVFLIRLVLSEVRSCFSSEEVRYS